MVEKWIHRRLKLVNSMLGIRALNNNAQIGLSSSLSILFILIMTTITVSQFINGFVDEWYIAIRLLITVLIIGVTILMWRGVKYTREALLVIFILTISHLIVQFGSLRAPITFLFLFVVAASPVITNLRGLLISFLASVITVLVIGFAEMSGMISSDQNFPIIASVIFLLLSIILAAGFALIITRRNESYYAALKKSDQAIEQSPLTVVITNKQGMIEYVNPRFTEITGYSRDEVIGSNPRILSAHSNPKEFYQEMYSTLESRKVWQGDFINVRKDGRIYYEQATICPILDDQNNITHYMALKEDVTKRKEAEMGLTAAKEQLEIQLREITNLKNRLQHQALHDPLTGLYNRRYLSEFIEREFERIKRAQQPLTILVLDIDHFKNVNDSMGHRAGDQVLISLSEHIGSNIRGFDICCRYGGEEFVVIMPGAINEVGLNRAEILREQISKLGTKFMDETIDITVSIGVATYPDHGITVDEILNHADVALYAAKRRGRNRVANWEPLLMLEAGVLEEEVIFKNVDDIEEEASDAEI